MNQWVLGSYFTSETPYEQVIKDYLLPTTEALGIRTIIQKIQSKGSWRANVAEKPRVILEILDKLPPEECLVFVDADARILKYPVLFDTIGQEYDLACHHLSWNTHYGYKNDPDILECLSGTLMLRNRILVRNLCKEWHEKALQTDRWEQVVLKECLEKSKLKVFELPYSYIGIATLPDGRPHPRNTEDIVISHHQVSRSLKRNLR